MLLSQTYRAEWTTKSKLFFKFIFSYSILYIVLMFTSALFETPFRWIGNNILGFNYAFDVNGYGSGDNTYAFITLFVNICIAIMITLLWSLLNSKRKEYNLALYWLLVVLRIFLIGAMLLYGFVKVFQIQFQQPSFVKLLQPLGEFSPMGLAWNYMGYSKGFGMFAGLMEILGGILLMFRKTSTLGAFVVIGVMVQVAMMNMMFDIPVKLFSIHLILMAVVIFITDLQRFIAVFIKNKATMRYDFFYPKGIEKKRKIIHKVKIVLIPILLIAGTLLSYLGSLNITDINHRPQLYGIWETQTLVVNNDTIPPLITDNKRWRYLIIERKKRAIIKSMTDELTTYSFITDTIENKIKMRINDTVESGYNLQYIFNKPNDLQLFGTLDNDSINVILKRKNLDSLPLISRPFRWINERPFNR